MSLFLNTFGAGPVRTIGLRRSWSCSSFRKRVRAATVSFAAVAGLVAAVSEARAQNCPPGYKIAAGACVQSCPGGYEDTGRACVYRRQGGGGGN
jgi:hypothetical protein